MYRYVHVCMHINDQYSSMRFYASIGIARTRALNIHPESRSKSGQISIFLLPPHDRDTLGGTFVPCRPEGAAVLGKHLQFVRSRSIIKEVRSLLVPKQHLPLKTSISATSSSTTRAALRWCFPSSSPSLCFTRPPLLSSAVPLVDQPTRCFGSVQQEDRPAANCHS